MHRKPTDDMKSTRFEHWSAIPNALLDFAGNLTPPQFRILMFIARRIYGWQNRDNAYISISQFRDGITSQDGRVHCEGVNLSEPTIIRAIKVLEAEGIIRVLRSRDHDGHVCNLYAIIGPDPSQQKTPDLLTEDGEGTYTDLGGVLTENGKQKKRLKKEMKQPVVRDVGTAPTLSPLVDLEAYETPERLRAIAVARGLQCPEDEDRVNQLQRKLAKVSAEYRALGLPEPDTDTYVEWAIDCRQYHAGKGTKVRSWPLTFGTWLANEVSRAKARKTQPERSWPQYGGRTGNAPPEADGASKSHIPKDLSKYPAHIQLMYTDPPAYFALMKKQSAERAAQAAKQ